MKKIALFVIALMSGIQLHAESTKIKVIVKSNYNKQVTMTVGYRETSSGYPSIDVPYTVTPNATNTFDVDYDDMDDTFNKVLFNLPVSKEFTRDTINSAALGNINQRNLNVTIVIDGSKKDIYLEKNGKRQ